MRFKKSLTLILLFMCGRLLQSMEKTTEPNEAFLKLVLEDQISALNKIEQTSKLADTELEELGIKNAMPKQYSKTYRSVTKKYEAVCPIFLLEECRRNGFFLCSFSRKSEPLYRQKLEDNVVESLVEKFKKNQNRKIQYVDFGTGGGFQALVIITKTLALKPDANLSIHLIEHDFEIYTKHRDLQKNSRVIPHNKPTDLSTTMPQLIEYARKTAEENNTLPDPQIKRAILEDCLITETRARQFIHFLKTAFPEAKLLLYVHESAESYLKYIKKWQIHPADVISAADIQDTKSNICGAVKHYYSLCYNTLKQNNESTNFFLGVTNDAPISIISLSTQEIPGSEMACYDENDQSAFLYFSKKIIETEYSKNQELRLKEIKEKYQDQKEGKEEEEEEEEEEGENVFIPDFSHWD